MGQATREMFRRRSESARDLVPTFPFTGLSEGVYANGCLALLGRWRLRGNEVGYISVRKETGAQCHDFLKGRRAIFYHKSATSRSRHHRGPSREYWSRSSDSDASSHYSRFDRKRPHQDPPQFLPGRFDGQCGGWGTCRRTNGDPESFLTRTVP